MPTLFRKKPVTAEVPAIKGGGRRVAAPTYVVETGPAGGRPAATPQYARFQYPSRIWLPLRIAGYALVGLGLINLVHAFGVFIGLSAKFGTYSLLLLLAALAGVVFSVAAGALVADALPSLEIRPEGLAVTEFVRWRVLPWQRITHLHSITLPGERFVIFVEYAGTPLSPEHVIYALLAGLGRRSGVFYTSDIKDFDDITRLILDMRMRATPGLRVEDLLVENVPMPVVQMAFDPLQTMQTVAGLPTGDVSSPLANVQAHPPTPRATLVRRQLGLAAVPVVLFWIDTLVNGGIPFLGPGAGTLLPATIGLLVVGMLELPFVALAIQALGEQALGNGEFQVALDTYPYLEMPRMLAFVVMFALITVRAPFFLIFLIWLAGLAYTAYLTLLFTQRLYRIGQNQAALAAGASALGQFFVLLAYLMLRAPGLDL